MAVRIREDGRIFCAAKHPEKPNDTYINDHLHYRLSVELKVLVTEPHEEHSEHGEWWWIDEIPKDVIIDWWYTTNTQEEQNE